MAVTSTPLHTDRPARKGGLALFLGTIGMWLACISFGGVFWAVNGGFSVIGLGVLASSFNDAGRLFWAVVSQWQFTVPVHAPGLPTTQPVIPWIGVVSASLLQISVSWLKMSRVTVPLPLLIVAILLSVYDYITTFFGLSTVAWLAPGGPLPSAVIALPLTFALEMAIGYALKRR